MCSRLAILALAAFGVGGCAEKQKDPDPDNQLPLGIVDTPSAGTILRPGPTLVGGWAVDDSRVIEIRVYFDGYFKVKTGVTVARPDVGRTLPRYRKSGDVYGWNVQVDFGFAPGAHTIVVQAVDDTGATRDIGVIPVTVPH